jgi:hypothetical protein
MTGWDDRAASFYISREAGNRTVEPVACVGGVRPSQAGAAVDRDTLSNTLRAGRPLSVPISLGITNRGRSPRALSTPEAGSGKIEYSGRGEAGHFGTIDRAGGTDGAGALSTAAAAATGIDGGRTAASRNRPGPV